MKLHFQFEECHNEELINFVKTVKTFEEIDDYIDNHDVSFGEIADAFYTVFEDDFTKEKHIVNCLWDEVDTWIHESMCDVGITHDDLI